LSYIPSQFEQPKSNDAASPLRHRDAGSNKAQKTDTA